jgi:hypothetical protein
LLLLSKLLKLPIPTFVLQVAPPATSTQIVLKDVPNALQVITAPVLKLLLLLALLVPTPPLLALARSRLAKTVPLVLTPVSMVQFLALLAPLLKVPPVVPLVAPTALLVNTEVVLVALLALLVIGSTPLSELALLAVPVSLVLPKPEIWKPSALTVSTATKAMASAPLAPLVMHVPQLLPAALKLLATASRANLDSTRPEEPHLVLLAPLVATAQAPRLLPVLVPLVHTRWVLNPNAKFAQMATPALTLLSLLFAALMVNTATLLLV